MTPSSSTNTHSLFGHTLAAQPYFSSLLDSPSQEDIESSVRMELLLGNIESAKEILDANKEYNLSEMQLTIKSFEQLKMDFQLLCTTSSRKELEAIQARASTERDSASTEALANSAKAFVGYVESVIEGFKLLEEEPLEEEKIQKKIADLTHMSLESFFHNLLEDHMPGIDSLADGIEVSLKLLKQNALV